MRLGDIVRIEQRPTLQTITRKDRERAITIFANVAPGVSQAEAIDRSLAIAHEVLPDGYRALPSGSSQAFQESFESLLFAFALGLIVAYMVLATQFNAFTHPFTVLLALPFSISGALLALWIARPEHERLQHARPDPADGHRQEELDHARGLHQPDPRAGRRAARGAARGLPDPAAPDPDDLDRHHRGRHARPPSPSARAPSCSGPWPWPWWAA